jgi:hypothetical protein
MWLKKFVPSLEVVGNTSKPPNLYCDNEPIVFTTITTNQSIALKHIDIKYYVVKDKI